MWKTGFMYRVKEALQHLRHETISTNQSKKTILNPYPINKSKKATADSIGCQPLQNVPHCRMFLLSKMLSNRMGSRCLFFGWSYDDVTIIDHFVISL